MNNKTLKDKIETFGNDIAKGIGYLTIGFFVVAAGVSIIDYIPRTSIKKYDSIQVEAGMGKTHKYVSIHPVDVDIDKNSYYIGAVDMNDDGIFQPDEFIDSRDNYLHPRFDKKFYDRLFDHYYESNSMKSLYNSVAPKRFK